MKKPRHDQRAPRKSSSHLTLLRGGLEAEWMNRAAFGDSTPRDSMQPNAAHDSAAFDWQSFSARLGWHPDEVALPADYEAQLAERLFFGANAAQPAGSTSPPGAWQQAAPRQAANKYSRRAIWLPLSVAAAGLLWILASLLAERPQPSGAMLAKPVTELSHPGPTVSGPEAPPSVDSAEPRAPLPEPSALPIRRPPPPRAPQPPGTVLPPPIAMTHSVAPARHRRGSQEAAPGAAAQPELAAGPGSAVAISPDSRDVWTPSPGLSRIEESRFAVLAATDPAAERRRAMAARQQYESQTADWSLAPKGRRWIGMGLPPHENTSGLPGGVGVMARVDLGTLFSAH